MMIDTEEDVEKLSESDFPLCEIDGRVYYSSQLNESHIGLHTYKLNEYPQINISKESLHCSDFAPAEYDISNLFLPIHIPLVTQLIETYYKYGLSECLRKASKCETTLISKPAALFQKFYFLCNRVCSMFPIGTTEETQCRNTSTSCFSQLSERSSTARFFRAISWHPNTVMVALATVDDTIRIFCQSSANANNVPYIRSILQHNISCMAWRPLSATDLAVAHDKGIIVWRIEATNALFTRPSILNATILCQVKHEPVVSLSWTVRGEQLISAALKDPRVRVWSVEQLRSSALRNSGGGGVSDGCRLVRMSVCGTHLVSAGRKCAFRLWECQRWKSERWILPRGSCVRSVCWVGNGGSHLLFATDATSIIYCLPLDTITQCATPSQANTSVLTTPNEALPLIDLNLVLAHKSESLSDILVERMESNEPHGNMLAVLLKGYCSVVLFDVVQKMTVSNIQLIGARFVSGIGAEIPEIIAFQSNFPDGACLNIGWSSGRFQYYPIISKSMTDADKCINSTHGNQTLFDCTGIDCS